MKNIIAIFRRELFSFFVSPVAYIVITGFVLLAGYFFFTMLGIYNMVLASYAMMPQMASQAPNLNQGVVEGYYHTLIVVLVFLIPLLTMRMVAEERRSGTFELLATSPLKVSEIVLGKYLAAAFLITVMILFVSVLPGLLCVYGNPEVKPVISGAFGLLFCALAFASIGMAASSFTDSQIVAAVTSMVTLLLLYVIHSPAESAGGWVRDLLMYLSPVMQVKDMVRGLINLKSVIYFLSLISLGIFLSQRALDAQRWR